MKTLLAKLYHWIVPQHKHLSIAVYLNLLFLSLFVGNLYFRPVYGEELAITIVAVFAFLILYFRAYTAEEKWLIYYIIAICLIGVVVSEINLGGNIFFIYAAAFIGQLNKPKKAYQTLASLILFIIIYTLLTDKSSFFWIPAIFMSFTFGVFNIQRTEIVNKNKALEESAKRVEELAKTSERERIRRDLHDLLGHSLSVITLRAELASKMIDKKLDIEKVKTEINAVETMSRQTLAQVRDAVKGYNVATITQELNQSKVALEAMNVELICDIETNSLPVEAESQLALIIREAITNIIRHATTTKVWVTLNHHQSNLRLMIKNEGHMESTMEGSGMQNMRTRIEAINGIMEIIRKPHTQLIFDIEFNKLLNHKLSNTLAPSSLSNNEQ